MPHICTIKSQKFDLGTKRFSAIASKWLSLVVISAENPLCSLYLRSETGLRNEKIRQLSSKHPFIIHPLSKFRKWYDLCIIFVYLMMTIIKPIDGSVGIRQSIFYLANCYQQLSLSFDILSWINILLQFVMGYSQDKKKVIEIRPSKIARNYLFSLYFIVDVLSSVPKYLIDSFYLSKMDDDTRGTFIRYLNVMCLLKSFRIFTVLKLISKTSSGFNIKSTTTVFLMTAITASLYVLHLSSCLMLAIPRLSPNYFSTETSEYRRKYLVKDYRKLYFKAMFKSSSCLFGIRYDLEKLKHDEDYVITLATYLIGKIITAITWIVLAVSILKSRSMTIKYQEMINQLKEYMRQKQLPTKLRNRILQYYTFKYQRKYFKEDMINRLLSDNLRNDINIHVCRSLIEQVTLFGDLTYNQVRAVVAMLVPEIFLPRDVIIQSGTNGDSMYFLSSGTVAVYTHSGKEICHLNDGAYFGEISLVVKDQARTATIIAIEVTQVYRLKRNDFEKTLGKNRSVCEWIIHRAEQRLKETLQMEESYKMAQFEKTYTRASAPTVPSTRASRPIRLLQATLSSLKPS